MNTTVLYFGTILMSSSCISFPLLKDRNYFLVDIRCRNTQFKILLELTTIIVNNHIMNYFLLKYKMIIIIRNLFRLIYICFKSSNVYRKSIQEKISSLKTFGLNFQEQ